MQYETQMYAAKTQPKTQNAGLPKAITKRSVSNQLFGDPTWGPLGAFWGPLGAFWEDLGWVTLLCKFQNATFQNARFQNARFQNARSDASYARVGTAKLLRDS